MRVLTLSFHRFINLLTSTSHVKHIKHNMLLKLIAILQI